MGSDRNFLKLWWSQKFLKWSLHPVSFATLKSFGILLLLPHPLNMKRYGLLLKMLIVLKVESKTFVKLKIFLEIILLRANALGILIHGLGNLVSIQTWNKLWGWEWGGKEIKLLSICVPETRAMTNFYLICSLVSCGAGRSIISHTPPVPSVSATCLQRRISVDRAGIITLAWEPKGILKWFYLGDW